MKLINNFKSIFLTCLFAEESLKRKTDDGEEETPAEVPEKRLKTAETDEAAVVEEKVEAEAEEVTA